MAEGLQIRSLEQTNPQSCQDPALSSALQLKNDRDPVSWPIDSNVLLEKALDDISFNIQRLETWNKSNQANIEDIQKKMESQYQHFNKTIEDTKNGNSKVFISLDEQIRNIKEKCDYFVEEMSEVAAWLAEKHRDEPQLELGNKEKHKKKKKNYNSTDSEVVLRFLML